VEDIPSSEVHCKESNNQMTALPIKDAMASAREQEEGDWERITVLRDKGRRRGHLVTIRQYAETLEEVNGKRIRISAAVAMVTLKGEDRYTFVRASDHPAFGT
jgi:hypothetical protein